MHEFESYEIIDGDYTRGMILLADHAMNRLPPATVRFGLDASAFQRHIAYDMASKASPGGWRPNLAFRLFSPAFPAC